MDDREPVSCPRCARERALNIAHWSEFYGSLGVAFTILLWLFIVSRVIVASAMLNAALAHGPRPTPTEVLHA
jgi:uncharacterized BrkB/YihY/UPF0761 family membrane protein